MSDEKTDAIVIRTVDFSETSSIVTFFTKDFGKISALAKGARRKKGPFESALDLLATCRIVFLHKTGDSLDLLTEAKLQHRLRASENGLSRLYSSYYMAELLRNFTDEMDPHPRLFDISLECLRDLENSDLEYEPTVLRYELSLLQEIGQAPSLRRCVACGRDVAALHRIAFGLLAGGVLCDGCRRGQRRIVSLRVEVIEILSEFGDPSSSNWRNNSSYKNHEKEIRPFVNNYFAELLGKRHRMFGYIPILGRS